MPDSTSENIGGVNITIGGDYSQLQADFAEAQTAAATAGSNIADAFTGAAASVTTFDDAVTSAVASGQTLAQAIAGASDSIDEVGSSAAAASGDVADLSDSADQLGAAAGGAGDAAGGAAGNIDQFGASASSAGAEAEESATQLGRMSEGFLALGEALAITEGMKEFGQEALAASDSITTASIALTTLTGSADKAHDTIEQLEALGMQDGLAMPPLLTAAQRMTALLPPGTDVVGLLGHIADGAKAMGTSVEQAANRFDMITNAGTLSVRALTSMGLSLTRVAAAMNTVDPSADATTTSVTAMFKAMDPGQRVQVLETALQGLAGTAQQVATQTFGPQWQQLANAWEQVMVQVGQAILPVISDLLQFTKTEIVPFIQDMVDSFNNLPGPIKDLAVGLALVTAAAVPLTAGIAALGLGLAGIQELIPAVNIVLGAFGFTAAATAVEEDAAAVATTGLGVAAAAAEPEIAGATAATEAVGIAATATSAIIGVALVAGITAAVALLIDFKARMDAAYASMQAVSQSAFNSWLDTAVASINAGATSMADMEKMTGQLKAALDLGVVSAKQYADAIKAISAEEIVLSNVPMKAAIDGWTSGLHLLGDSTQSTAAAQAALTTGITNVVGSVKAANDTVAQAKTVYDAFASSIANGTPILNGQVATVQQVKQAYADYTNAMTAANGQLPTLKSSMADVQVQAEKLGAAQTLLTADTNMAGMATDVAVTSLIAAGNTYSTAAAKAEILSDQVETLGAKSNLTAAQTLQLAQLQSELVTAWNAAQKAGEAYTGTVANLSDYLKGAATDAANQDIENRKQELAALQMLAGAVSPVVSAMMGLDAQITALQQTMPGFGVQILNVNSNENLLKEALDEANVNLEKQIAYLDAGTGSLAKYDNAQRQVLAAQEAVDVEAAIAATGTQGLTDAYSLNLQVLVAAQAKLQDMDAAFQHLGGPTAAQMLAAQNAVTSAQTALNKVMGETPGLISQVVGANNQYISQAPTVVAAAGTMATAMTAVGTAAVSAAQEVAQSISSIAADVSSGIGAGGGAGGAASSSINIGAAPAGYHYSYEFIPQGMAAREIVTLVPDPGTALALEEAAAQATAGQQANPHNQTDAVTLATEALAEDQALLGVMQQYFSQGGNLVTLPQLQAAQSAVASAQTALTTAQAAVTKTSVTTTSSSGSNPLLTATPITGITTAGTTPVASASAATGSMTDGSGYPYVSVVQDSGQVLNVAIVSSGGTSTGTSTGTASSATDLTSATSSTNAASSAAAASATASAVGTAATTISNVVGTLQILTSTVQGIAAEIAAAASKTTSGSVVNFTAGSTQNSVATGGGGSNTSGTAVGLNLPTGGGNVSYSPTPLNPGSGSSIPPNTSPYPYMPTAVTAPPSAAAVTVHVDLSNSTFGGSTSTSVSSAVLNGVVRALRDAGARNLVAG